jgi:hypothetical protein
MRQIELQIVYILLAASLGGQQKAMSPTVDRLAVQKQVREYLRDITELELTVKSDLVVSDASGADSKETHSAHLLTYNAGTTRNKSADVQTIGPNKAGDWETHADAGLFAIAYAFLPDQGAKGYYHTAPKRIADSLVIEYGSRERCSAWRKSWFGWHGFKFKEWCGTGDLHVTNGGLPIEGSFTAAQLGPDLRSSDVPTYAYAVTFRQLSVQNSVRPFVVPRDVTLTVTYRNHKVVVHNVYSARLSRQND